MPVIGIETARTFLRAGDAVMVTWPDADHADEGARYALLSGRGTLRPATFKNLLPELTAAGDSLFPDEASQTYRIVG